MTLRFRADRRSTLLLTCAAVMALFWLPCRADAPPGYFTDNKNGTVTDNKTGLLWQQGIDPNSETWANAGTYCEGLVLNGGGWRLPSMKELFTLVDVRRINPAIDPAFFPNTPSDQFRTSSPYSGNSVVAWDVYFSDGSVVVDRRDTTFRVRCVR